MAELVLLLVVRVVVVDTIAPDRVAHAVRRRVELLRQVVERHTQLVHDRLVVVTMMTVVVVVRATVRRRREPIPWRGLLGGRRLRLSQDPHPRVVARQHLGIVLPAHLHF